MRIVIIFLSILPLLYLVLHFSLSALGQGGMSIAHFLNEYTFITIHTSLKHPLTFIQDTLGVSALILLIATLLVSPLHAYLKISLFRHRRLLGIITFIYALAHFLVYFVAIKQANFSAFTQSIAEKNFIVFGIITFSVILLMAFTSNRFLYDKFYAWHKLIYLALISLVLHILLAQKSLQTDIIIYVSIIVALLSLRLLKKA